MLILIMDQHAPSGTVYTVSDGNLVLNLEVLPKDDGGGFGVTSPMEPSLITEANSLEEAFFMARDAIRALQDAREEREEKARETARQLLAS